MCARAIRTRTRWSVWQKCIEEQVLPNPTCGSCRWSQILLSVSLSCTPTKRWSFSFVLTGPGIGIALAKWNHCASSVPNGVFSWSSSSPLVLFGSPELQARSPTTLLEKPGGKERPWDSTERDSKAQCPSAEHPDDSRFNHHLVADTGGNIHRTSRRATWSTHRIQRPWDGCYCLMWLISGVVRFVERGHQNTAQADTEGTFTRRRCPASV